MPTNRPIVLFINGQRVEVIADINDLFRVVSADLTMPDLSRRVPFTVDIPIHTHRCPYCGVAFTPSRIAPGPHAVINGQPAGPMCDPCGMLILARTRD